MIDWIIGLVTLVTLPGGVYVTLDAARRILANTVPEAPQAPTQSRSSRVSPRPDHTTHRTHQARMATRR